MKKTNSAVVWDLHGTLADTSHRKDLVPADPSQDSNWDKWSLACAGDTPIRGSIRRMQMDFLVHQVHIATACGTIARELTREWLIAHAAGQYDYLYMRARGDCRSDKILKTEYIAGLIQDGLDVRLVYEDRKDIADHIYATLGVPCLLVNPAYEWIEVLRDQRP